MCPAATDVDVRQPPKMPRVDQIVADLQRMQLVISAFSDDEQFSCSNSRKSSFESIASSFDYTPSLPQQQQFLVRQGSVRGVHNGVNSTIRRLKIRKSWKRDYQSEDSRKIVVYVTSCSVVRRTWDRCRQALAIMENLNVRFECRDLNLCPAYYEELHNRIGMSVLVTDSNNNQFDTNPLWDNLPMIFVDGEYFGDEQTLNLLNETGELKRIFQPYIAVNNRTVCPKCFGFRFRPCQVCRGGKRSPLRFANLQFRCVKCDDNGIVACQDCPPCV